jgi:hypothetical protein
MNPWYYVGMTFGMFLCLAVIFKKFQLFTRIVFVYIMLAVFGAATVAFLYGLNPGKDLLLKGIFGSAFVGSILFWALEWAIKRFFKGASD